MGKHFTNQLTKWLPKEKLDGFLKSQMKSLGKIQRDYIVRMAAEKKRNRWVFAVFTVRVKPERNVKLSIKNAGIDDLLALSIGKKASGVSILKTLSRFF